MENCTRELLGENLGRKSWEEISGVNFLGGHIRRKILGGKFYEEIVGENPGWKSWEENFGRKIMGGKVGRKLLGVKGLK